MPLFRTQTYEFRVCIVQFRTLRAQARHQQLTTATTKQQQLRRHRRAAMIECTTCGAQGEANFSTNYFGELVCELCGTQSFLQSRNETQDMEDTNLDVTRASTMKRATRRSTRAGSKGASADADSKNLTRRGTGRRMKRRGDSATLLDCLRATQTVLRHQAAALAALGGFPDEFADAVERIWFQFLETWERKSARPLLRCFTEFFLPRTSADKAMDPALTQQLLEQWGVDRAAEADDAAENDAEGGGEAAAAGSDASGGDDDDEGEEKEEQAEEEEEEEGDRRRRRRKRRRQPSQPKRKRVKPAPPPRAKKLLRLKHYSAALDQFSIVDLLGILVLAARVLNLGVLPCDVAYWVETGELPFHNLLSVCSQELQAAVYDVSLFFESTVAGNRVTAARVAYHTHYLQHHLELPLPPLNASLAAYTMCANLGFPPQVFRHFQWIAALVNAKGARPEPPLLHRRSVRAEGDDEQLLESSVGIAAHLAVAVKMTANWHEWIYERPLRRARHVPPYRIQDARRMPRHELGAFVDFCEDTLVGHDRANIPPGFESHVYDLRGKYSERSQQPSTSSGSHLSAAQEPEPPTRHALLAYPALYVDGVCDEQDDEIEARVAYLKRIMAEKQQKTDDVESESTHEDEDEDDVFFYPLYAANTKFPVLHAAYENVLELLCEYIDAPVVTVLSVCEQLDREVQAVCKKLEANVVVRRRDEKAQGAGV